MLTIARCRIANLNVSLIPVLHRLLGVGNVVLAIYLAPLKLKIHHALLDFLFTPEDECVRHQL